MNGVRELLQAGHRCTCTLQAGRAPDRWRQDLQQQTTRIKALPQQCHWIASVAKVQMKLQDQPLWGSCLPSLTGGSDRPTETPSSAQPRPVPVPIPRRMQSSTTELGCPAPKRFPRRSPTEPQRTEQLAPSPTPQEPQTEPTPCSVHEPLRLPTQASADLLQCLVQKPAPAKPFPEPICEPKLQGASTPDIPPRQRFSPIVPTPKEPPKLSRIVCLDDTNQKRWRQQLIQRSEDSLRSGSHTLNTPVPHRLQQKNSIELLAVEESSSHPKQELPNNPWLCSLGTMAPLDLLTDLVTPRSTSSSPHDRTPEPEPQRRSLPAHEPRLFPEQQDPDQATIPPHSAIAPWQNTQTRSRLEMLSQLSPTQKHKATAELERIDPPAVAPTLPPLVAPQTGEDSLSVTTPLIQQRAQQEAMPETDFDGLASQIKRILDEEARRYGINV